MEIRKNIKSRGKTRFEKVTRTKFLQKAEMQYSGTYPGQLKNYIPNINT